MMKTIEGYTYKVNQHIGKGYSSTVHKGLKDKTGEEISIKVIQMSKLEDPINQMLLQLEVTSLKQLANRKHILHLYDVYATKNNTYLITELCQTDLSKILKQRKSIPFYESVQILSQIIQGYNDIHNQGFIHRDIKPANIFYKNGIYKIGDFGFTIPIADIPNHKNYNVGSPVYMPPEALKENMFSVSCDTWAIGIIFCQLIKGVVPWRAISEKVLHDKILSQPIDNFTQGMPEIARKFIREILAIDPSKRTTPAELISWPSRLQKMNSLDLVRNFSPSPMERREVSNALQEINTNQLPKPSFQINIVSPNNQMNIDKKISFTNNKQGFKIHQQQSEQKQNPSKREDSDYTQANFFSNNFINLIKFTHRILKFLSPPTSSYLNLHQIQKSFAKYLFHQIQQFKMLLQNKNVCLKVDKWAQFIKTSKGQEVKRKVSKYENKYKMFHQFSGYENDLSERSIQECIKTIMEFLQKQQNFSPKMVICADYLTTFYQLFHLRQKYTHQEFMNNSKIDLIMQGNPYNAKQEHLEKLRKKISIICL